MHIPDGFLSVPVWGTMDAIAIPSVALIAKRAQREFDHHRIPLMGVMGAFIFAAQMINFPVGNGTSGHLLGGALLSFTLGPAAASIVMTAILATQALVFQDGGLLALGANVFNMAIAGVLAGYLPYVLLRGKKAGIFLGGVSSVLVSALLALAELFRSGVRMPSAALAVSIGLFVISAVVEGAITLAVMQALERRKPGLVPRPRATGALAAASLALVGAGVFLASQLPDGIQKLALQTGIAARAQAILRSPLAGYKLQILASPVPARLLAGIIGLFVVYILCLGISRILTLSREGA
ncbi:MAG TPA: energy-coupling factor ABC transporter permease [Bryobacteraceae bacterium]|jgi:cobalt/nickel transport system permease protein|nr:energy-coupling factor ABC transporter permease [Bryobacteraceae bacterium]